MILLLFPTSISPFYHPKSYLVQTFSCARAITPLPFKTFSRNKKNLYLKLTDFALSSLLKCNILSNEKFIYDPKRKLMTSKGKEKNDLIKRVESGCREHRAYIMSSS